MPDLPVILKLQGQRCLVIGGGAVAVRRTRSLLEAGAQVTLVSPQMDPSLSPHAHLSLLRRAYQAGDLANAKLVVIATNEPAVNATAAADAKAAGVWVNRADEPELGDLLMPAHAHHGPVTIAVHTSGASAAASAAIRRELSAALAPHWPVLLAAALPWRSRIQEAIAQPQDRRARLIALTDARAINTLVHQGLQALDAYYAQLADPALPWPSADVPACDREVP